VRAEAWRDEAGTLRAKPFALQDSSMISTFARSQALIVRPPHAPAVKAGDEIAILPLKSLAT